MTTATSRLSPEAFGDEQSLPAARAVGLVSARHRGGKRRADVAVREPRHPDRLRLSVGRRAATGTAIGALVDATDAAAVLADEALFWDPSQILAHAEIADLALADARGALVDEASLLGRWSPRSRRARAAVERRRRVLLLARQALAVAHARDLVSGD